MKHFLFLQKQNLFFLIFLSMQSAQAGWWDMVKYIATDGASVDSYATDGLPPKLKDVWASQRKKPLDDSLAEPDDEALDSYERIDSGLGQLNASLSILSHMTWPTIYHRESFQQKEINEFARNIHIANAGTLCSIGSFVLLSYTKEKYLGKILFTLGLIASPIYHILANKFNDIKYWEKNWKWIAVSSLLPTCPTLESAIMLNTLSRLIHGVTPLISIYRLYNFMQQDHRSEATKAKMINDMIIESFNNEPKYIKVKKEKVNDLYGNKVWCVKYDKGLTFGYISTMLETRGMKNGNKQKKFPNEIARSIASFIYDKNMCLEKKVLLYQPNFIQAMLNPKPQSTDNNILPTNSSDFSTDCENLKMLTTKIANDILRPYSFHDKEKLNPHGKPILPLRLHILLYNYHYKNYPPVRECFTKLDPKNPYGKLVKDYNFNRDPYYKDKKELVADIKESINSSYDL